MERRRLEISGTVQGVGFRPFVVRLARTIGVAGSVGNDDSGVWCDIQGPPDALDRFEQLLRRDAPPLAAITGVVAHGLEPRPQTSGFVVAASDSAPSGAAMSVPADAAPCRSCLAELDDPANRRFGYPFTCCTDCGPRFTVVDSLPYDRERTAMAAFPLCDSCAREYRDPTDRRFHGQAICCPTCGPKLELRAGGQPVEGEPIDAAAALLRSGAILAVKGVGGFQLVCRADGETSVQTLRTRKQREEKPFALMVSTVLRARDLVDLDEIAERALTSPEAPIVLAKRREGAAVADAVAPATAVLGVMLPASPLHRLLAASVHPVPLVCTSGNRSSEPIVTDDERLDRDLGHIADAVLTHDRRISRRADDSVGRVVAGDFQLLRRARGYAPRPIRLASSGPTVLGVGAELKSTVALAAGADAHVSVHLGDLEQPAALAAFEETITDLVHLTRSTPELVVHDLHPEYLSTKFATTSGIGATTAVQHHHAHLVSCLVDNGRAEPAIGFTFDGLGWGSDDTLWGGEVLVGDDREFTRRAHLAAVPMPGGSAAIRQPWRMAISYLVDAFGSTLPLLPMLERNSSAVADVAALSTSDRSIATSSIGRLFDAVAALCDLADTIAYEGQAAIVLEQASGPVERRYDTVLSEDETLVVDTSSLIGAVVDDLLLGAPVSAVAGGFHRWIADVVVRLAREISNTDGLQTVALTGGVFQNRLLVETVVSDLTDLGFEVLRHRQVPPNDGGISLGQVAIGRQILANRA